MEKDGPARRWAGEEGCCAARTGLVAEERRNGKAKTSARHRVRTMHAAPVYDEMRDYQPKKQNQYYLPHTLYRRVLALVRDYPRMTRAREDMIYESPENAGSRNSMGRPTENKALRIEALSDDIRAIERALDKIPREYRQGVLDNVLYGRRMDDLPGARSTWSRWRGRFLWHVAKNMRWI